MAKNTTTYCRSAGLCIYLLLSAFSKAGATDSRIRILFIGNSLTYTNNLPAIVQEIGRQDSILVSYTALCFPDFSLEDHWNEGRIQKEIAEGLYHFVVVQQGPSAMQASRVLLNEYVQRISKLCQQYNTGLCLYTVWPAKARLFDLDSVIASYKNAAASVDALLAPAGLAWKLVWQSNPQFPLYGPDDFHPSLAGSLLAAFTIYASLRNKTSLEFFRLQPESLKKNLPTNSLSILADAAVQALKTSF